MRVRSAVLAGAWLFFGGVVMGALAAPPKDADDEDKPPRESGGARERREPSDLEKRAEKIRPTAAELRWRNIPWVASAEEATKAAKAEKRPIFIFAVDGDPFDRV